MTKATKIQPMKRNSIWLFCLYFVFFSCDSIEDKKGRFLLKGNEKLAENDPKGAIAFYQEALELDSLYKDAYFNKALAHLELNQLNESILDFSKAIQIDQNYIEAIFQRGLTYLDNGEFYKAKADAENLLNKASEDWRSYFLLGLSEEKLKNYQGALAAFQRAKELDPDNSDLWVNEATVLFYQEDLIKALTSLEKAEELNPMEANIYNLRSMILFAQGEYSKANSEVDKALEISPSQAYFYNNKGLYLLFLEDLEGGLDLINQSIKMDPKNQFALRNKGIYYVLKNDKESALSYLTRLNEDFPDMDLVKEYYEKAQALE
ncbi:tetratricopeptide repeat protein [Algoriphagus sediminis]|nr:tetratricopeptide repeat protein [Algoriphagus sediminis]